MYGKPEGTFPSPSDNKCCFEQTGGTPNSLLVGAHVDQVPPSQMILSPSARHAFLLNLPPRVFTSRCLSRTPPPPQQKEKVKKEVGRAAAIWLG